MTVPAIELKTPDQRLSYALGIDIAASLSRLPLRLDQGAFVRGFEDVTANRDPLLSPEEFQTVMQEFQATMQQQNAAVVEEAGNQNLSDGREFLASNKTRPGVTTTASGLQYEVLTAGSGATPAETDSVTVHYTGTLIDGTEFDSSVRRGEPASFPVNGVIPGWTEALQLMKVGGKYRLFVPSELAYGPRGAGQAIGPNAALIFEVELLSIDEDEPE